MAHLALYNKPLHSQSYWWIILFSLFRIGWCFSRGAMFLKFPAVLLPLLGHHKIQPPLEKLCSVITENMSPFFSSRPRNRVMPPLRHELLLIVGFIHSNIYRKETSGKLANIYCTSIQGKHLWSSLILWRLWNDLNPITNLAFSLLA